MIVRINWQDIDASVVAIGVHDYQQEVVALVTNGRRTSGVVTMRITEQSFGSGFSHDIDGHWEFLRARAPSPLTENIKANIKIIRENGDSNMMFLFGRPTPGHISTTKHEELGWSI